MDLSGDFRLVFAVVAASAGVAGALVVKGLAVLAVGLVIAAYLAGLIQD